MIPFSPDVLMSSKEDGPVIVNVSIADVSIIGTALKEREETESEFRVSIPCETSINDASREFISGNPVMIRDESETVPLPVMNWPDTTESVRVDILRVPESTV